MYQRLQIKTFITELVKLARCGNFSNNQKLMTNREK